MLDTILSLEARLETAVRHGDSRACAELLGDRMHFPHHEGRLLGQKTGPLDAAAPVADLLLMGTASRSIHLLQDSAVVSVSVHMAGTAAALSVEGTFHFHRVWTCSRGCWQVNPMRAPAPASR